MESRRNPRFQRTADVRPIKLTTRDRQIIRLIYRHRFLRSTHIASLLGDTSQHLSRRLQLLYHHGFLERPRAQLKYFEKGGSEPIAYGLGSQSASILKEFFGIKVPRFSWGEKSRAVGGIFLAHALFVSDVMVAIELACRVQPTVRLLTEEDLLPPAREDDKPKRFRWKVKLGDGKKLGVVPDGVFGLEFPDTTGNPTRAFFFVEADRGTMPVTRKNLLQTSFLRKMMAYEATWSQGIHQTRFGFHRFRVLSVTTSSKRLQSLLEACSRLNRGRGLFLFGDSGSLHSRSAILSQTWHVSSQGRRTSLLE